MELSKHIIITVPLYQQSVMVFYRMPNDYIRNHISEESYRDIYDSQKMATATATSDPDTGEYIIAFNPDFPPPSHGVIAHEFLHISSDTCEDVGIRLNNENQEAIAYVMAYLIDAFYAALHDTPEITKFNVEIITDGNGE